MCIRDSSYSENDELKGIAVSIRYAELFRHDRIIFDLKKIKDPAKVTPFLCLLEFAKKMSSEPVEKVFLQYKGRTKYYVDGVDFKTLGVKASFMDPDKLMLDFPEMLKDGQGRLLFEKPYGDEQWVRQKKMKNFRVFLFNWYIDDWIFEKTGKKRVERTSLPPVVEPDTYNEETTLPEEIEAPKPSTSVPVPPEDSPGQTVPDEMPPVEPEEF